MEEASGSRDFRRRSSGRVLIILSCVDDEITTRLDLFHRSLQQAEERGEEQEWSIRGNHAQIDVVEL